MKWFSIPPLVFLLAATVSKGQSAVPVGAEFQVNTYTTSGQFGPALSLDTDGDFVVVWHSYSQDGSSLGVEGQRFSAAGTSQGGEFQVNTYTTGYQSYPSVSLDAAGNFVVVWEHSPDGGVQSIYGQMFSADGTRQGNDFLVNTFTEGSQSSPVVSLDATGNFVVVWTSCCPDGSSSSVAGRRFLAGGVPVGDEFQINTYTTGIQARPDISLDVDGDFVVVWQGANQDLDGSVAIRGQRFSAGGAPLGGEFQVNAYGTGDQKYPSVGADADGDFVVSWQSPDQDGDGLTVMARRFSSEGTSQGDDFQVNTYTTGDQRKPDVSLDADGNFVIVWTSCCPDGSGFSVEGRQFLANGLPQGDEFQVNTHTTSGQYQPAIGLDTAGDFVVVWTSNLQDGEYGAIEGQRFGTSIFADGFESGDISAWSSSQ